MVLGRMWSMFTDLLGSHDSQAERMPALEPVFTAMEPGGPDPSIPLAHWNRARIALVESLWGEGFIFPAGEQETLRLAKPLALSEATSLLLVGAGSGGPVSCIAAQLGAWVTGFEADPDLALLATERSSRSGFGKRAAIKSWDPAQPNFARRSFHHALALEP